MKDSKHWQKEISPLEKHYFRKKQEKGGNLSS
jgi:hypothetical protein